MCRIEGAVNWPVEKLARKEEFEKLLEEVTRQLKNGGNGK